MQKRPRLQRAGRGRAAQRRHRAWSIVALAADGSAARVTAGGMLPGCDAPRLAAGVRVGHALPRRGHGGVAACYRRRGLRHCAGRGARDQLRRIQTADYAILGQRLERVGHAHRAAVGEEARQRGAVADFAAAAAAVAPGAGGRHLEYDLRRGRGARWRRHKACRSLLAVDRVVEDRHHRHLLRASPRVGGRTRDRQA